MLRLVSEADTVMDGMLKYPNHIRDAIQFVTVTPKHLEYLEVFLFFSSSVPFLNNVFRSRKEIRCVSIFQEEKTKGRNFK